ncbi:MAG: hypothetical protein NC223_02185, partial [Butyrivibrio sp.]|nr:hypothetical protein [Butyrivibrio sp.]
RKRGKDTVTSDGRISGQNGEGRHEEAGLPFDDIKEWAKKTRARLVSFFGRQKGRRGADNPVIREINFNGDGGQENYDDTELVKIRRRSKKRFKPAFAAAAVTAALLAAGVIVAICIARNRDTDKSRVFIYDGKSGFYADDADNPLIADANGTLELDAVCGAYFIAHDGGAVYIGGNGGIRKTEAESPRIIAYNETASLAVYEADGRTHILTAENDAVLELDKRGGFTDACAVSADGSCFVLTVCEGGDDFAPGEYTVYFGDSGGGLREIMRDYNEKEIISLDGGGRLVFADMETADYGIINGRTLSVWEKDGDGARTVMEDISDLGFDEERRIVYFLTANGELYRWDTSGEAPALIDREVSSLCKNSASGERDGAIYRKDDGFYLCDGGKTRRLFDAECASPEFYFDYGQDFLYYRDTDMIYNVSLGKSVSCEPVCTLKSAESLLYYPQGGTLLAVDSYSTLWELGASREPLGQNVSFVSAVGNDGGIAYGSDGRLMYRAQDGKPVTLSEEINVADSFVFSRGKIYFRSGDKTAYRVSRDGGGIESICAAEYLFFTE